MKHAFRLKPGQDLREALEHYAVEHTMTAGFIVTCVGSVNHAVLRMAGAKVVKEFDGKFEIVSLVGTVSTNGSHLHLAISDESGAVFGGHLKSGTLIETTAEIIMNEVADTIFRREPDPATGFDELVVDES